MYFLFNSTLHFSSSFRYGGHMDSLAQIFWVLRLSLLPSSKPVILFFSLKILSRASCRFTSFAITTFLFFSWWIAWKLRLLTSTTAVWNTSTTWSSSWSYVGRPKSSTHSLLVYCSWPESRFSLSTICFL